MAIFTSAELETHIAAYKAALLALPTAQSYTIDSGGSRHAVTKADLPELRNHLEWLQRQKNALDTTGASGGPQILVGRPMR